MTGDRLPPDPERDARELMQQLQRLEANLARPGREDALRVFEWLALTSPSKVQSLAEKALEALRSPELQTHREELAQEKQRIEDAHRNLEAKLAEVNQQLAAEKQALQREREALEAARRTAPVPDAAKVDGPLTSGYLLMAAQDGELTPSETATLEDRMAQADPALRVEWAWLERARAALRGVSLAGPPEEALRALRERALSPAAAKAAGVEPPEPGALHRTAHGLEVVARRVPVPGGADWFDVLERAGGLDVLLGGPSGRGERSALAGAAARGALRALLGTLYTPYAVLRDANRALCDVLGSKETFVMAAVVRWDEVHRRLVMSGAAGATVLLGARTGAAQPIKAGGVPLGLLRDAPASVFKEREVELARGDTLVLVSDGLAEALDPGHDPGAERLRRLVERHAALAADALVEAILLEAERREPEPQDDRVVVVLRRPG